MSGLSLSNVQISPNYAGSILKDSGIDYMQLAKGLQMGMELREKREQYALARAQRELEMQQMQAISGIGAEAGGGGGGSPAGGLRSVMGNISKKVGGGRGDGRGDGGGSRRGPRIIGDRGEFEGGGGGRDVSSAGGLGATDKEWNGMQIQGRNADARQILTQAAIQVKSVPPEQREGAYNAISASLIDRGIVDEGQVPAWNNGGAGLIEMIIKQNGQKSGDSRNPGMLDSRGNQIATNIGAINQARADGYVPYQDEGVGSGDPVERHELMYGSPDRMSLYDQTILGNRVNGANADYGDQITPEGQFISAGPGPVPGTEVNPDLEMAAAQYSQPTPDFSGKRKPKIDTSLDDIKFEDPYDPMMGMGTPGVQGAGAAPPIAGGLSSAQGTPVNDAVNQMNTLSAAQQLGFLTPAQMMEQYNQTPSLQAQPIPGQAPLPGQTPTTPAGQTPPSAVQATAAAPETDANGVPLVPPSQAVPLSQQQIVDQEERAQFRRQNAMMDYQINALKRNVAKATTLNKKGRVSTSELSSMQVQLDAATDAKKEFIESHKEALKDRRDAIKEARAEALMAHKEQLSEARLDRREAKADARQARKDAEKNKEPEIGDKVKNLSGNVAQQAQIMYGGSKAIGDMSELYGSLSNPNFKADLADVPYVGRAFNAMQDTNQQKYNFLRADLTDRIARLRTGAAFSESEADRFLKLIPSVGDDADTARYKLSLMQDDFNKAYNNLTHRREDRELTNTASTGTGFVAARAKFPGLTRDVYEKWSNGGK